MKTRITEILNIQYPIIQGGMAWVAEHRLAAAVSNAGGLGIIGAASAPPDVVREEIRIGSEVLSKLIDWNDRSTCILFGDGAGAVLLETVEDREIFSGLLSSAQHSDGAKGMVLKCRERALDGPFGKEDSKKMDSLFVQMDGQEVYRFATRQVPNCIREALKQAKLSVEDIDLFILHQANIRIIEAVAKRLHADIEKFPINLDRVGNMSSATIPVLLDELNREGKLHAGDKIVMSGFGAGLTYGACVFVW